MRNPRRFLLFLLAICVSCPLTGCGDLAMSGLKGAAQKVGAEVVATSSDESLRKMFEQANAACPTRMDAFTTLEEVVVIDDNRVEFRYLVSDSGKRIASRLDKRAMKRAAVAHVKGNPMAVAIAERDLSIEHIYKDSAGNHVLSYTINRAVLDGNLDPMGSEKTNPFTTQVVSASKAESVVEPVIKEAAEEPVIAEPVIAEPIIAEPIIAEPVIAEPVIAEPVEEKPPLPQEFKPRRTKDNPAGVQHNPFFDNE